MAAENLIHLSMGCMPAGPPSLNSTENNKYFVYIFANDYGFIEAAGPSSLKSTEYNEYHMYLLAYLLRNN